MKPTFLIPTKSAGREPIDRKSLVARHAVHTNVFDPQSPLQVGNGRIAFNADCTGLQSFCPLNTLAHWGWHSFPLPAGLTSENFQRTPFEVQGRKVGYATGAGWNSHGEQVPADGQDPAQRALSQWLYQNPQRLNLGRLGLRLTKADGSEARLEDLRSTRQHLDLWTGMLSSFFEFEGQAVRVRTCCHADRDIFGFHIDSPLIHAGQLEVRLSFPSADLREFEELVGGWDSPTEHRTTLVDRTGERVSLHREVGATQYGVFLHWESAAEFARTDAHTFALRPDGGNVLAFGCAYSQAGGAPDAFPLFDEVADSSARGWEAFWGSGGCMDFSECTDPRAFELERRVVLSQYALAVNSAGPLPSQESGLLSNSWHGKFHLEMYWWHSAHYALWDRWPMIERSIGIYQRLLSTARETAQRQGYEGARWPKMIGPEGRESAHIINSLLIWQQPHPLFFAELEYRLEPTHETLERWREVVFETANFMASYAHFDPASSTFNLGPPLFIVAENTDPVTTRNPTFELTYWRCGLRLATTWWKRLGLPAVSAWQSVLDQLAPLPVREDVYIQIEGQKNTYTEMNWEHPALIGAFGMLPGDGVNLPTMRRTVRKVAECWQWERCWGWDFPMMAMAAARTGEADLAVEMLLELGGSGKCYRGNGVLTAQFGKGWLHYLPGNGGLLYAAALMAAGWDGAPEISNPGFPADGRWKVRWEGLRPAP